MTGPELFLMLKKEAAVWEADRPEKWFPFDLLGTESCPFYIGRSEEEALRARGERDRSRMVRALYIGGSDRTEEGYYFYGDPLPPAAGGGSEDELHGRYAVLSETAVWPGGAA